MPRSSVPAKPAASSSSALSAADSTASAREFVRFLDAERQCVADELHANLCQTLSCMRLSLSALRRKHASENPEILQDYEYLEAAAGRAVNETHELISILVQRELEPDSILMTLEETAREFHSRFEQFPKKGAVALPLDEFGALQLVILVRMLLKPGKATSGRDEQTLSITVAEDSLTVRIVSPALQSEAFEKGLYPLCSRKLVQARAAAIPARMEFAAGAVTLQVSKMEA
jgi:hypothetical protein